MCQKTSRGHCAIGEKSTVRSVVQIKAMADGERWKGLWCSTQTCWYQSEEIIQIHARVEAPLWMFSWSPACMMRDRAGCPNVALIYNSSRNMSIWARRCCFITKNKNIGQIVRVDLKREDASPDSQLSRFLLKSMCKRVY